MIETNDMTAAILEYAIEYAQKRLVRYGSTAKDVLETLIEAMEAATKLSKQLSPRNFQKEVKA